MRWRSAPQVASVTQTVRRCLGDRSGLRGCLDPAFSSFRPIRAPRKSSSFLFVVRFLHSLWLEPRPPTAAAADVGARRRFRTLDAALVATFIVLAIVEALVRDDVPAKPLAFVSALVVITLL